MRFTIALAVFGIIALTATTASAQSISAEPTYGSVSLDEGFLPDPHSTSLTAGGSIEVNKGSCSYGYVANAPDVDLYYTSSGGSNLYVYVRGDDDTTLLINTPSGQWVCNDDGLGGSNPVVVLPGADGGLYNIWVGTYGDDLTSATLYISEVDPR
ncbi:MAG: hypothetical protein R3284_05895 [Rubricoccaceae bacterium]|nr:hypothetical protein [Rubricoccaceae bacterium]